MARRYIFLCSILALLLNGCDKRLNKLRQKNMNGARVGLLASSMQENRAKTLWPEGIYRSYLDNMCCLAALKKGEVDAVYTDELVLYNKYYDDSRFDLAFIDNDHMPIAGAFRKSDKRLNNRFSAFLREIKSNGMYVRMKNRWTLTENIDSIIPPLITRQNYTDRTKTLTVGIVGEMRPYSIRLKGQWTGFENELWARFAAFIGRRVRFVVYDFDNLIPALLSHKVDAIAAAMTVTDERSKQVLFTSPYSYSCSICLVRK